MSLPLRHLPVLQHWDCHSCSDCCRIEAPLSAEEKARLEKLDLAGDSESAPGPWFEARGANWVLRRRPDGRCVFLTDAQRCRLQERFGAAAKPFVCRLYPFLLIPAGDHWRVGLHYGCPSAAENRGRPVAEHEAELRRLLPLLEQHVGRTGDSAPPPPLQAGQLVGWPELLRLTQVLVELVQDRSCRLEVRLRRCLALARLCRQARLESLRGGKLSEFLAVVRAGLAAEVPAHAADVPAPGWIGRVLFRNVLAIYARRDDGLQRGPATLSRLGRLRAGWRFARGSGPVPRLNAWLPETTFAEVAARPSLPVEADATLERYYVTKLTSLQFCGPPHFELPFWTGLEGLVLTLPVILWLAKALAAEGPLPAVHKALVLVDHHFGSNRLLGSRLIRFALHTLADRGEIDKLVAWYSR